MKRFFRIGFLILLLLIGGAMLTWYFIMRREVPEHARCIPKDAVAVFTVNLREMALDYSSGGHLFPEMANEDPVPSSLKSILKAIEKNDGSGLRETADILGFFYQENDEAYIGICAALSDSSKLSKLVFGELAKKYPISRERINGGALVHFDSTSAVLGWNSELALYIMPFSDHGGEKSSRQCERLLSLKTESSVLTNENFRSHELSSFDAGLWVQAKPFLRFTNGGKLFRIGMNDVDYISLGIDFNSGETNIRRIISYSGKTEAQNSETLICCDPKDLEGFWNLPIDLNNDSLRDAYAGSPPLDALPFSDEEMDSLMPLLNGNCTVLLHDTISYEMEYITYKYDEEFNQVPVKSVQKKTSSASTLVLGLADEKKVARLIRGWMQADTIPENKGQWAYTEDGMPMRLILQDKNLVLSSWPSCDGKQRPVPKQWDNLELYFQPGLYLKKNESSLVNFFLAGFQGVLHVLEDEFASISITEPLQVEGMRSSNIRIRMKNKKVNTLIQFGEIMRKGMKN